ncbi:sodium-dependent transporter [Pseudenhygromyxa sp. WMMC2535]|uniref:sodium-dependent transporter n=1 Tax=Pseudenhygromyxa sp. WMMC2535 TaxID=2712867 RepID=UPI0015534FE4|nr:sodium-dependent transporter [Pseudenhygromyxa sp. WMMC2535]NVB43023.1 sodium-dependent transporter [Pseudenhygromyxa sp. WMMC2535]
MAQERRGEWGSRLGFILAAAGSAVGLGNVWKFPYITGENGGGLFVIIYLICIAFVGLPIMIGEVMLGRMTQRAPVGAFTKLAGETSPWRGVGWIGVAAGFVILSYYSVVAGWALDYTLIAARGEMSSGDPAAMAERFGEVAGDGLGATLWHVAFMGLSVAIVIGGVQKGVEIAARVLMPLLFAMFVALLIYATRLEGFSRGFEFVFGFHTDKLGPGSVLEALGHSFFTLSVGMGAMLTYGSYLKRDDDIVGASVAIALLDTAVALLACLVLFPITFTYGMEPAAGPSLVFTNIPMAFAQLPGSTIWAVTFFLLLVFAALTSAISLLEVTASYFIDERGWSRSVAVPVCGAAIVLLGIPSALTASSETFGAGMEASFIGMSWFDLFDYVSSNWMLPLCGLGISVFAAWRLGDPERRAQFEAGSKLGRIAGLYLTWLGVLRWLVPVGIGLIMLHALGVFG